MSRVMRKPTFWFPTWSDTNRAVQSQKMDRGLKFQIKKVALYSKRINSANGISRSFFSSHKCFFKTYKNAFKPNASNWE